MREVTNWIIVKPTAVCLSKFVADMATTNTETRILCACNVASCLTLPFW